jgi:aspartate aminotransferase-like enzyme
MPGLLSNVDPDGLLEYSVVFTDRSLNHMSQSFQKVMNDISKTLKRAYNAKSAVVVPGGRSGWRHFRHGSGGATVCYR